MLNINKLLLFLSLAFIGLVSCTQNQPVVLSENMAWCWFSDPRAVIAGANDQLVITGGVGDEGSIKAVSYNLKDQSIKKGIIHPKLETDDHNNPAFLERPDGKILAFYTKHHRDALYMSMTKESGNVENWTKPVKINPVNEKENKLYGESRYTYANPAMLSKEQNRIYLFGRWTGFKPTMAWSDDGGKSWSQSRVVICPQPFDPGNRPYLKYFSDGNSRIHMTFTDGHPRDEPLNSVYYAYYENGFFFRTSGDTICSIEKLPFEPKEATKVYDAQKTNARAWVYDIRTDQKGNPVIAYAQYPDEQTHLYHYARFDGEKWTDRKICDAGKWFPQTPEGIKEREPHYSGGLVIDAGNPYGVYVSREKNGVFEIEHWMWNPEKKSGTFTPITQNSQHDQVRPVSIDAPESKKAVLWMENLKYIHYTDFKSSVKLYVE